jgi:hypothetical protein
MNLVQGVKYELTAKNMELSQHDSIYTGCQVR